VAVKWIAGLGNPGKKYERSRHNVGFRVADLFATQEDFGAETRKFKAVCRERLWAEAGGDGARGEAEKVVVFKPLTYMNLSGLAVRDLLGYYGTRMDSDLTATLIVVYDDMDLPVGRLRFRARGSSGGHRGLESVLQCLGNERFSRLRIGIGRQQGIDAVDYVLAPLGATEEEALEAAVRRAADSLRLWIESGVSACMNRFNSDDPVGPRQPEPGARSDPGREASWNRPESG
jgi:PTH1 family peptidyl-tRNA hydrolase